MVEESNLAQYLHLLRKTLGKTKDGKPFIETFRRRGYRFNGVVNADDFLSEIKQENTNQEFAPLHAPTGNGAVRKATSGKIVALADWRHESEADDKPLQEILPVAETKKFPAAERKTILGLVPGGTLNANSSAEFLIGEIKSRKRGLAVGLTVLLLASIGLGYRFFANPSSNAAIESIAVLPFENAGGDASLDYLSDGLSESLIDRLAQLSQLKVIARSSSFKYRGNPDLPQVANALGVQAIVTGRVVQRGDNLIIRVEMIDTRDNRQLWSDNFTRKLSDAQKLQADITREITENLHLRLSGTQTRQLAGQETSNPQAYELLLKGIFYWRKRGTESSKKAVEYYEQAIAVDPNYALAYAKLSAAYIFLAGNGILNSKEFIPKAEAAARKALELDENLADAHLAMAMLNQTAWDWAAAEAAFKRAIELNSNLADVRIRYTTYLGVNLSRRGIRPLRRPRKSVGVFSSSWKWARNPTSPASCRVLYAALGEREKAFASFEKAYAARDSQLQFLKVESNFDSLRDDPRFQDLLRRVGLPQ